MRCLAILLSLSVLDGCATSVALRTTHAALRGDGDTANLQGCQGGDPCFEGDGGGGGGALALGVGAAALGIGVGALIYKIVRSRPASPAPRT